MPKKQSSNGGLIGGVIGGLVAVVLIGGLIYIFIKRKKNPLTFGKRNEKAHGWSFLILISSLTCVPVLFKRGRKCSRH